VDGVSRFSVHAYYEGWDDEDDVTAEQLEARLRAWGFDAIDIEDES
jgi:hypothetical protein